ncbi:ABC transporter permease [Jatrophihabitans endophyticus]|uniref:ABC transporter permease n=1 Tax=Jatrophihabitans endophyticus TaxID=1206085 RepID=UPI001A069E6F|nr:ABC transporter permease [Jatrophihabitans endophyticus]MBE7190707.1 ABC transporter permease [Jatrophihabitans endophyticus]
MSGYLRGGFSQAWHLIVSHDPVLWSAIDNTIEVALVSTAIATVVGVPLGVLLGLGRFRGRGFFLAVANAGLGLPPVLVGIVGSLLLFPAGPLGSLRLIFTLRAVIAGQTVLAFPVVVALTASAVSNVTPGLLDQARAFDARRYRVWQLAARESRVGIVAAIVAAAGTALSEVAAVVLLGGNIQEFDQTLGSFALEEVGAGNYVYSLAIGIVLIVLIMVVSIVLTTLQHLGRSPARRRRSMS